LQQGYRKRIDPLLSVWERDLKIAEGMIMTKKLESDVIVVGAGTAGCFFAWQLGKAGYKVLLLEARKLVNLGKHIEIFHMDKIRFDEFGIPHPTQEEIIHVEEVGYNWSPDLKVKQPVRYTIYVMRMPAFIQRMQAYARETGATILEEAEVKDLILVNGCLAGVTGQIDGENFEARARLVVDATGLAAAVRTKLPQEFGVENTPVPAGDCLFVCLEFRDEIPAGQPSGSNSYMFHKAFWNKSYGEGAILGIGQPNSFEFAWQKQREWREEYFGNPGKVLQKRQGVIPYHRPPFSLVGNGFMVIGDAANQNKPFSGEGVTSGFTACRIAAEIAAASLKSGTVSQEALWPYNVRYFRGQGAKFAGGLAQLPVVAELSRKDVNYLFHHNIIFSSPDFEELNRDYEIRMGTGKLIKVGLGLIWGALVGQFSWNSLTKFLSVSGKAGRIKEHYLKFPASLADFPAWEAKARQLWEEA
jgi:digeranylgeranylglycerophospholipid reductase